MRTLCLGEALVDLVCPRPVDGLVGADSFVPRFGGATANVAVTAARHGGNVALAGGAGDDAWGAWLRDRLAAEGVGLEFFQLVAGAKTAVAFVTVDADAQPSFQIYGESIETVVSALADRLDAAVESCDALFIASNTLVGEDERALTLRARERALELGQPVVFDPNFRLHRWPSPTRAAAVARDCVRGAFLVKCNAEEARLLSGERDPEAAAAGLIAGGARHVVVTLGADGALLRGGGLRVDTPGVPARPVDTTGAGDALIGVLLARLGDTGYYPPAIAAALPEAVAEAARATERWGALG
jgi:sugar/nucleoside kinase (ribokinase family)